ncbi:MAG: hypothetical protein QOK40_387, partial [Miltoncostaeaceae bacterium]|nr:hypothetical protein [Miltoncostaeaceae bacterium]
AIGVGVFEETVNASGAWWVLVGAAAAAMVTGLIALSRPGLASTGGPAAPRPTG